MKTRDIVVSYLEYRRALGEVLKSNESCLNRFIRYVGQEADITTVTTDICERFISKDGIGSAALRFGRWTIINGLFKWALARGYVTANPVPADHPRRPKSLTPYIYKQEELKALFDNALKYSEPNNRCHPETIRTVLQVTYMLGLRISETLNLKVSDVDLTEMIAYIRETKFFKSRITPFNIQVKEILQGYLGWKRTVMYNCPDDGYLFVDKYSNKLDHSIISSRFKKARDLAGIKRTDGSLFQPRIHDLRHTFAVNRLIAWYDSGMDVQRLLPILSTYLGHTQLAHTSVYLTMTDRLLNHANERFESFFYEDLENGLQER